MVASLITLKIKLGFLFLTGGEHCIYTVLRKNFSFHAPSPTKKGDVEAADVLGYIISQLVAGVLNMEWGLQLNTTCTLAQ